MRKFYTLIFLLTASAFQAQVKEESFDSFQLQQQRDLVYYLPEDYDSSRKYSLILVLDAEYLFDLVVSNARFYSRFYRVPESIIVGIKQGEFDLRWYDCDSEPSTGLPTERSMKFYNFIVSELLPSFEDRFSTAPFRMFIGYDITANFGNYFLFEDRSLFTSYLLISPVLAEDMEIRVPSRLNALDQKLIYNLVLEKAPTEDRNRILQLDRAVSSLEREQLTYFFDQYESPDHTSISAHAMGKAFDNVFRRFRPITPREYEEEMLSLEEPVYTYLLEKYSTLEELLGYEKDYELSDLMAVYHASREKGDLESLKFLLKEARRLFPDTMMPHFLQGEIYERDGDHRKALKAYGRAYTENEISVFTREQAYLKIAALKNQEE